MDGLGGARVTELWRYPVKSMRGERDRRVDVGDVGLTGDRAYAVVDAETGKVGSAKHPRLWGALLQCEARYAERRRAGAPLPPVTITLPDGAETGSDDPDVDDRLSAVFGRPVHLTTVAPEGNTYLAVWPEIEGVMPDDFRAQNAVDGDEADGHAHRPVARARIAARHVLRRVRAARGHHATLDRLGELAPESRFAVERYRPNIVIDAGGEPFAENDWSRRRRARRRRELTAIGAAPDDALHHDDARAGRPAPRQRGPAHPHPHNRVEIPGLGTWSCVGAYAAVTAPGRVQVGDPVTAA